MAWGKRFTYRLKSTYTHFWDSEHPENLSTDVNYVATFFGTIVSGYILSPKNCTDVYFYFGDTNPPPLVVSYTNGVYVTGADYEIPTSLEGGTRYYLKATFLNVDDYGDVTYDGYFDTELKDPQKSINPIPIDGYENMTLSWMNFSWESGSDEPPDEECYDVYFGTTSGNLTKIIEQTSNLTIAKALLLSLVGLGNYSTTYYWRIDAIWPESELSAEGDEWSFSTIKFKHPQISYILLYADAPGPYDIPPGEQGVDWQWTGENLFMTQKRFCAAANSCFWYEQI